MHATVSIDDEIYEKAKRIAFESQRSTRCAVRPGLVVIGLVGW